MGDTPIDIPFIDTKLGNVRCASVIRQLNDIGFADTNEDVPDVTRYSALEARFFHSACPTKRRNNCEDEGEAVVVRSRQLRGRGRGGGCHDLAPSSRLWLAKQARFSMSDANLAHACTVMDLPAAQATPEFLKDQPHDVRMYTPRLIERYTFDRQVNEAILQLAAEVYAFKGDFLELTPAVATSFPTTPLVASMNTAKGSHFLHQLELPREVAVLLKVQNLCTQRMFWLTNHTPGCNWDTYKQLEYRAAQDAGANLCNPGFTPLSSEHVGGAR
jgi:hypothetical protein